MGAPQSDSAGRAGIAQPWFDLVAMLPSIALQGGPSPEMICQAHPVTQAGSPPEAGDADGGI